MTDREFCSIWIEEYDPPYVRMMGTYFSWQNSTHVQRRVGVLAAKYSRGWHCGRCRELMPVWKRVDAKYCTESCRKMDARDRRSWLM